MSPAAASERRYFAVPDPADAGLMTYWRQGRQLTMWPPGVKHGPRLAAGDVPKQLRGTQRRSWIRRWFREIREPWDAAVRAALDADRDLAAARFAAFSARCCCCGRALSDPASKTWGIGPDCREGLPVAWLERFAILAGRAHADRLNNQQNGPTP